MPVFIGALTSRLLVRPCGAFAVPGPWSLSPQNSTRGCTGSSPPPPLCLHRLGLRRSHLIFFVHGLLSIDLDPRNSCVIDVFLIRLFEAQCPEHRLLKIRSSEKQQQQQNLSTPKYEEEKNTPNYKNLKCLAISKINTTRQ